MRDLYKRLKVYIPILVTVLLCGGVIGWQFFEIERLKTLIPRGQDVEEDVNYYSNFTAIALRGNDQVVHVKKIYLYTVGILNSSTGHIVSS